MGKALLYGAGRRAELDVQKRSLSELFTTVSGIGEPWRSAPLCGVSSSLLGHVHTSFRALSGRLIFTARRHKFNKDPLSRSFSQRCLELEIPGALHLFALP